MINNTKTSDEMLIFLKESIIEKNEGWIAERLFKLYLLFNKAMNLINELALMDDFFKGLTPELIEELNITAKFLQKVWSINKD